MDLSKKIGKSFWGNATLTEGRQFEDVTKNVSDKMVDGGTGGVYQDFLRHEEDVAVVWYKRRRQYFYFGGKVLNYSSKESMNDE